MSIFTAEEIADIILETSTALPGMLDDWRKILELDGQDVTLLRNDPASPGNYLSLGIVTAGFLLDSGGEGIELIICEAVPTEAEPEPVATAENLKLMTGCAFQGKYFKIRGTDKRQPLGSGATAGWKFLLTPTAEEYP